MLHIVEVASAVFEDHSSLSLRLSGWSVCDAFSGLLYYTTMAAENHSVAVLH